MDLIFFGMQGAGKGTIGKLVAKKYDLQIFETGAALRSLAKEESDLGKKIKSIIEAGKLVPNEVVMEIVEDFMEKSDSTKGILFDGIPRKIVQAESLNTLLDKHNRNYKAVLLDINQETALKRLTTRRICQNCKHVYPSNYENNHCEVSQKNGETCSGNLITRSDDNPEAIKTRLDAFANETLPAINIYKDRLIKIDGEPSIEDVEKLAYTILEPVINQ